MAEKRVTSNQRIMWRLGPDSGITWTAPTLAQVAALDHLSDAIKIDGTDYNIEASEQQDDRSFADAAGSQSRGFAQFGGTIAGFTPPQNDSTSNFAKAHALLATPRVKLAVAQRFVESIALAPAAGQEWTISRVMTDSEEQVRGEVSYSYATGLQPQDDILVNYILPSAVPTAVTITPSAAITDAAVGDIIFVKAAYEGRNVTAGAEWASSDETVIVSHGHGIFECIATGAGVELTADYLGGVESTAVSVDVTA